MAAPDTLSINVYIFGDPDYDPFRIQRPSNTTVQDLQLALCREFDLFFEGIHPYSLKLWKLNKFIHLNDLEKKLPADYADLATIATTMKNIEKLSDLFESPPEKFVHVIVYKPEKLVFNPNHKGTLGNDNKQLVPYSSDLGDKMRDLELKVEDIMRSHSSSRSLGTALWSSAIPGQIAAPVMVQQISIETRVYGSDWIQNIRRESEDDKKRGNKNCGERVIYIPDCGALIDNFDRTIRAALCFAFYDDPATYSMIESAYDVDAILRFTQGQTSGILIVDQIDALETYPNDPEATAKETARRQLIRMVSSHKFIHSSSANILSTQTVGQQDDHSDRMKQTTGINTMLVVFQASVQKNERQSG
ncbi:12381_t:CDS:2, partial [Acaulospora colombiana]